MPSSPTSQASPIPGSIGLGEPLGNAIVQVASGRRFPLDLIAGRDVVLLLAPRARLEAVAAAWAEISEMLEAGRSIPASSETDRAGYLVVAPDGADVPKNEPENEPENEQGGVPEALRRDDVIADPNGTVATLLRVGAVLEAGDFALVRADRARRGIETARCGSLEEVRAWVERIVSARVPEPERLMAPAAPVLRIPSVFEPDLCAELIAAWTEIGPEKSGFMRDDGAGGTVGAYNDKVKRRRDAWLPHGPLRDLANRRIGVRMLPELERVYGFRPDRMERYLIAGYDAVEQGVFTAHRDNSTRGTAHRQIAVSINLNPPSEYDGGGLCFPEYGSGLYVPEAGEALCFGCGMLHEVRPVTRGRRHVFLTFLYSASNRPQV